jgi:hypothetical protein
LSTRSRIAIKQKDNTYKSIYCHNDGDLEHNGVLLYYHYADPKKVKLLTGLGDISRLEENVFPDITKEHNFNNKQDFVCVAYHRDRGEDLRFEVFNSKEELLDYFSKSDQDYLYLFENDKWYFVDKEKGLKLESLEDNLLRENLIDNPSVSYSYGDELAVELMNYAKDFDTYEYNDIYNSDDDAFNDMKKNLTTTSGIDTMIEWLCNDIHYFASENDLGNNAISNLSKTAFNLLIKLNQYSKVLEKEDNKEMDV